MSRFVKFEPQKVNNPFFPKKLAEAMRRDLLRLNEEFCKLFNKKP